MKTLFVSLAALLFAFFVGCQSSITDPADTQNTETSQNAYTENSVSKDWISSLPGLIKIHGLVKIPRQLDYGSAEVEGFARYSVRKVYFDSPPPAPQSAFEVKLYVKATITASSVYAGSNKPWRVESRSEQFVYNSPANQTIEFLEKSIRVQSDEGVPLKLVLKFQVDEKMLNLVSMKLKLVNTGEPIGNTAS